MEPIKPKAAMKRRIYQFKVVLKDISPDIWRRFQVWENCTLDQLHRVLQITVGWENYHLYEFRVGRLMYRDPHPENERKFRDPRRTRLCDILSGVGVEFEYLYDFGDGWRHSLLLESILLPTPGAFYPRCIAGERSGPPEDSGGHWGYENYLRAMADPEHEEHEDMMAWRGPFDSERFSIQSVNRHLEKKFRPKSKQTAANATARSAKLPPEIEQRVLAILSGAESPNKERIRIKPGDKVPLELNDRERELILSHTLADDDLTNRLRVVPKNGARPVFGYTLDDLEELGGFVAAEAAHTENKRISKELNQIFDRIQETLESYTDEPLSGGQANFLN